MKKTVRILLALSLIAALLLCGCGGDDPKGTVAPNETTAENPLSLGRMEGGVYTNAYAELSCKLDESWTYLGAEELQELPETVKDMVSDTDLGEVMSDMQQFTDMAAENAELLCNMNLLMTKLDLQSRLTYVAMTEEQIMEAMLTEKDTMIAAYAQMGINVTTMELRKVQFAGQEHTALYTAGDSSGIPVFMTQIMDYHKGAYGITLTLTSFVEDNSETMLALFSAAK